jgi:hypothetical protein
LKPVFKSKPEKTASESFSEYSVNSSHDSHPKTESNIVLGLTKKLKNGKIIRNNFGGYIKSKSKNLKDLN